MTKNYSKIESSVTDRVARIILNAPPLNIIDMEMMHEISSALAEISKRDDLSAILFSGSGEKAEKAFSAGVSVAEHTPELVNQMLTSFHKIFRQLAEIEIVTVACVHGHCLGGGLELAAFCDFVIASDDSKFSLPEIKLGCFPPVATALFPSLIGRKQAERLMITGESIDAEEAKTIGLVSEVVTVAQLESKTANTLEAITSKSVAVIALLRKSEPNWRAEFLKALTWSEMIYLDELTRLADMQEGINAFNEKRKPDWRHA